MRQNEHKLQSACFKWFSLQYPQYDKCFFAIPNGGLRNIRVAAKLKSEGVKSGVADSFLALPELSGDGIIQSYGLFIEFKSGKNKQTESQKEFQKSVESFNYKYAVIYNIEDFINLIKTYLS